MMKINQLKNEGLKEEVIITTKDRLLISGGEDVWYPNWKFKGAQCKDEHGVFCWVTRPNGDPSLAALVKDY